MPTDAEPATPKSGIRPSDALAAFRTVYAAKAMRRPANNADELIQMKREQGMYEMPSPPTAPAEFPRHSSLPATSDTAIEARHLWVIRANDVPVALESCAWGKDLESRLIKHSNLTGGAEAHCGGELWFIDRDRVIVSGVSGRYGPDTEGELSAVVDALRHCGYYVASLGFDFDNKSVPNTVLIGDPIWEAPL
jgi:hypothetical protein